MIVSVEHFNLVMRKVIPKPSQNATVKAIRLAKGHDLNPSVGQRLKINRFSPKSTQTNHLNRMTAIALASG